VALGLLEVAAALLACPAYLTTHLERDPVAVLR
jgi:hypothetical protein